jgi:hypothetical protein
MSLPLESVEPVMSDASSRLFGQNPISVPREVLFGALFRADLIVEKVARPDGSPLLRLGSTGGSMAVCLDPSNGRIVSLFDTRAQTVRSTRPGWSETTVNSSLSAFMRAASAVTNRFPYYSLGSSPDQMSEVARELRETLASIDPLAVEPDRLWSTFLDDVAIGDYATENVGSTSRDIRER